MAFYRRLAWEAVPLPVLRAASLALDWGSEFAPLRGRIELRWYEPLPENACGGVVREQLFHERRYLSGYCEPRQGGGWVVGLDASRTPAAVLEAAVHELVHCRQHLDLGPARSAVERERREAEAQQAAANRMKAWRISANWCPK